MPSQIIRIDSLAKANELRDAVVISGMRNHLAEGHAELEDSCSHCQVSLA